MRLRAVIIDDEETGIDTLKLLIDKYIVDVKVVAQATQASQAIEIIENYQPEIVFLDISMPEMDGFELLEKLTWKNFNLVFTTAHQEYGLKALKNNAVDYLLKPVDHNDLRFAVNKIVIKLDEQKNGFATLDQKNLPLTNQYYTNKLAVNSKIGVEYIEPNDIICLESKSNYTLVYLNNSKTILTPKTLKEFETQLCSNTNFMRVHHSFIINSHNVLRYLKDEDAIIMLNTQKIPLAKSRRDVFFSWLKI